MAPSLIPAGRLSPIEAFLQHVEQTPGAPALRLLESTRELAYAQLLELMERCRHKLQALGVCAGERVLVMLPPGPDFIACVYALWSLSAIAVPVSGSLTDFELLPMLRDASPVGAIADEAQWIRGCWRRASSLRFQLCPAELYAARRSALEPPAGDPVVSCHFTYKGLGYPLGALHRYHHYSVALQAIRARSRNAQARGANLLSVLPQYPVYGLVLSVLFPLSLGWTVSIAQRPLELDLLRVLSEQRVQLVALVPELVRSLCARARGSGDALALHETLELVSGASFLSEQLAERAREALGVDILQGYGSTESLPITANCHDQQRTGSLGVPLGADTALTIVDARGAPVAPGRIGAVVVAGPTVMDGYIGRPSETARFLREGRLITGDLGSLDAKGFLHFHGRSQPFTKQCAQMVDLTELEHVLGLHPSVARASTSVQVDAQRGDRVQACVLLTRGARAEGRELRRHCARYLSAHKLPRMINVLEHALHMPESSAAAGPA